MASYFNLVLDTLAPQGLTVKLNNGSQYTTSKNVTLSISVSDTSTSGYQMKVWGINGAEKESDASWETFATSKSITLLNNDGLKTVYVKVRDDVYNETASASATITLDTSVPAVTIIGPDVSRISKTAPKNVATFSFTSDVAFTEYKVKVVPSKSSLHDSGVLIGSANGSTNMSATGTFKASTAISCKIYGKDLEAASSGDGEKIIKVFVKNAHGTWSVA
ncbi:hypothetical protein CATMIT_01123 [Catenibacterium mitsuokai DSM 15897]|uniref:hypothetical protein n=1 Tax=Catenibacterium mitsuokai TaxID=100886 RepID=UPI000196BC41|nr:hypothetical protein [Catenibacterium mitsuokai]EEF94289.1 hypothetical protein CATMIT_01123 [Catenibacterium mitsuokai DSM 15897]UWO52227.1 hypothetical protein NQ499_08050 [Catenibacterium mitsuokai]